MKTVAICDTGFSSEILSLPNVIHYKDFGSLSKEHGTMIARTIISICPKCKLILASMNVDSICSAIESLRWINLLHPDILNISWVTKDKEENIIKELKSIENYGTKIFCAKNDMFKYPWIEFTGIDSKIENDHYAGIPLRGSSVSCAIFSAKQALEEKNYNEFISVSSSICGQVNLKI